MNSGRVCAALLAAFGLQAAAPWPRTIPERTDFRRTSTVAEVKAFMDGLRARDPHLVPYRPKGAPAATEAGKPLNAWRLPATGKGAVRVYVNANIHAGEAEGKEAIQQIVRELLEGKHPALRRGIDLVVLPCYNADGTDALDPAIRPYQPNPEESGVGRRENAQGLDLNRDLMKAEAANTRWLLAMLRDFDPAVLFDLHTTNGSTHGFFLTHGPAVTLGADPGLLAFNRRMLVEVREKLKTEGLPTYDYGNFKPYKPTKDNPPTAWESYDAHPRLLSNYPALQNRLGVLSESYVYRSWPQRIDDTRRFVLGCLEWIAGHRAELEKARQRAMLDWVLAWGAAPGGPALPLGAAFKEVERYPFDWVDPVRDGKGRVVGEKSRTRLELPAFVAFEGRDPVQLPLGYLVDGAYRDQLLPRLRAHGIQVLPGSARPKDHPLLFFKESGRELSKEAYQGIFTLKLQGAWSSVNPKPSPGLPWSEAELDRALWIPLSQPYGRLAFYLLDPRSDDGYVFWGLFHPALLRGNGMWGEAPRFPILAVGQSDLIPARAAMPERPERAE